MHFPSPESHEWQKVGELDSLPPSVANLSAEMNTPIATTHASVLWHEATQHIRITNFQPAPYYREYFMTTTYSGTMQELQASQSERLFELTRDEFGTQPCSLLEVGCGDGSFLSHAAGFFDSVVGIEPSAPFAAAARSLGHEVIEAYVGNNPPLTARRFHAFASRQVFEHLSDPVDVLLGVRRLLVPGAVGLIEVPNGSRAFRLGRFFEVFPDHVNYFSPISLTALASTAGFSVISCEESLNGDYLELWLRTTDSPSGSISKMNEVRQRVLSSLDQWRAADQGVVTSAFFGAGAKAMSVAALDYSGFSETFTFAIDSDPHKHGLFIPNTNIEVLDVSDPRLKELGSVLILALSYREEIAKMIEISLPEVHRIATLDDTGGLLILK